MRPTDSPPVAKIFFYKETLYLYAIPNIIWFFISLAIIGYMTYTKYRLSKGVAPQHNIQVHIPSVSGRLNQDRIPPNITSASQIVAPQHNIREGFIQKKGKFLNLGLDPPPLKG